jgi:WbqC-like protein family
VVIPGRRSARLTRGLKLNTGRRLLRFSVLRETPLASKKDMILSTYQPYFAPFPGFFHKMLLSDTFVVLDEVQFPRGTTWITRNRFKHDQGNLWITVPVRKKGLGLQKINQVKIHHEAPWARKHLASLKAAYLKAPYFHDHLPFLEEVFSSRYETILDLNLAIIEHLMKSLGIETKLILLSSLGIGSEGNERLVEVCRSLGASQYLAQSAARKYLDHQLLSDAHVEVKYVNPPRPVYPQLWGDFIVNLSTFDLLFNCGPKSLEVIQKASGSHFVS